MRVLRINPNLPSADPAALAAFYGRVFDLSVEDGMGWIAFVQGPESDAARRPLLQVASEGGSGTELPALTIEVDDLDAVLDRARAEGMAPEYGPMLEPWCIRRFYLRDPAGTLINVAMHT